MNRVVQSCVSLIAISLMLSGCQLPSIIPIKSNPGPTIDYAPPEPPFTTLSPSATRTPTTQRSHTTTRSPTIPPSSPPATLADIFAKLPPMFTFSSGAGGWSTDINIYEDGMFGGYYSDSNMGETGPGYPKGTKQESLFEGRFVVVSQINQYEYQLKMVSLKVDGTVGAQRIEDGVKITITDPYGFDDADEFRLYLPGRPTADLPEQFLQWVSMPLVWPSIPKTLPIWGLYNVGGQEGFYGVD